MNDFSLLLYVGNILRICVLTLIGIPLVRWCSGWLAALCSKRLSRHVAILVGQLVFYGGLLFIAVTVLHELGFNISALLGAAGVLGIAVGFAAQTSIANIISGFFLLFERPFSVGDIIKSVDTVGYVESVDLLSVRVRTLDNKMVRLPNEMVLKQSLSNFTYYPIKRVDCVMSLPYKDDVEQAKQVVQAVVANNPLFVQDPVPVVSLFKMAQHDFDTEIKCFLMIRVWVPTNKFRSASAILMQQLKDQFDKNNTVITIVQVN